MALEVGRVVYLIIVPHDAKARGFSTLLDDLLTKKRRLPLGSGSEKVRKLNRIVAVGGKPFRALPTGLPSLPFVNGCCRHRNKTTGRPFFFGSLRRTAEQPKKAKCFLGAP